MDLSPASTLKTSHLQVDTRLHPAMLTHQTRLDMLTRVVSTSFASLDGEGRRGSTYGTFGASAADV